MKSILIIIAILVSISATGYIGSLIYSGYQLQNIDHTASATDYTKEQYLNQVRENGGSDVEVCAYSSLIDQYGTRETLKMDLRATADENDVDQRMYTALQECL